jgi:uncharacterized protein (TIGR02466 family)
MTKAHIDTLFVTKIYQAKLAHKIAKPLNAQLLHTAQVIAADDVAGQAWCLKHGYKGYTSYASLNDLAWRATVFQELVDILDGHVTQFAKDLAFDLGRERLKLDSLWLNILEPGGVHTGHIHPQSVISGTYYVSIPKGSSVLKFEDPRLGLMMAAPRRRKKADIALQPFVERIPSDGTLYLWESWLRHEVPINCSQGTRVSISFNYA